MTVKRFALYIIILVLASCTGLPPSEQIPPSDTPKPDVTSPSASVTPSVVSTATKPAITASSTPEPSATVIPSASPTATVTGFPLPLPGSDVVQHCLVVEENLPTDFIVEGQIVRRCSEGLCLINFQNQEINQSAFVQVNPDHRIGRGSISPNMVWLAYEEEILDSTGNVEDSQLWLASMETRQKVVSWKPDWTYGWIDNDWLLVKSEWNDPTYHKVLLNPFTAEIKEITLPPIHNPYPGDLLIKDPQADYDTSFTRVIYLYDDPISYFVNFALWDVQADKLLWEKVWGSDMAWPEWSSDEQWLAVVSPTQKNKEELFIVDRDGQNETQLTNLATTYPGMNIDIGALSWSPDGRYISFWFNVRKGEFYEDWHLAVLEIQTRKIMDYCYFYPSKDFIPPGALWSPDSQHLALNIIPDASLENVYPIVIDVPHNRAVRLPSGGPAIGWLLSPQGLNP